MKTIYQRSSATATRRCAVASVSQPSGSFAPIVWLAALLLGIVSTAFAADPNIAFTSIPSVVEHNQLYYVEAQGTDPEGNLVNVMINKDGAAFAHAGESDGVGPNTGFSHN